MLLLEIEVTRLFSVLFFHHFSFFAISLVMSGLVLGGILAARWDAGNMPEPVFRSRLALLGVLFAGATTLALLILVVVVRPDPGASPSLSGVALHALMFLPGLIPAGAFLALAFARSKSWIGALYAYDLLAAAAACIGAIWVLRTLQGPAMLLGPILLSALAPVLMGVSWFGRGAGLALAELALVLAVANLAIDGQLLRLQSKGDPRPVLERWNEHSRIQVYDFRPSKMYAVIDRSAGTDIPPVPSGPNGRPIDPPANWRLGAQYDAYRVGRRPTSVAIIGVGGGRDLLPAIAYHAKEVDGYELNQTFIDLLQKDYKAFNAIASRPEVRLIHGEARVNIGNSDKQYDVIQASLIDTWAATASGGFVLSENGLYTREGWRTFIGHLTPTGILTMTRWYLPDAPAEVHRLVALAGAALAEAGIDDAAAHTILISSTQVAGPVAFSVRELSAAGTILVSKSAFQPEEVQRLSEACAAEGRQILTAPGLPSKDATIRALLSSSTRGGAIAQSPFNISPPTDTQPYFFLQIRPRDLLRLKGHDFGPVTEITFNGVRVLMMLAACALGLVGLVVLVTVLGLPGAAASAAERRSYRAMTFYFLGIGLGYIFVQLSLHQRLIIVIGHPTFALSVVLFAMLLGTGVGAALSVKLFPDGGLTRPGLWILATLCLLWLGQPWVALLERVRSLDVRMGIIGLVVGAVGLVLGFAFPLGVRRVAPTGEWAVQKMWAVNGAASIAASVIAALVGLSMGSGAVLACGIVGYSVAILAGAVSARAFTAPRPAASAPPT